MKSDELENQLETYHEELADAAELADPYSPEASL
jgi:hypothetical protein